ncbi:MAG: Ig-like domain-containing protein, partial [Solobacterium sp.]|nr:Ig-like domain-containing protein [Solobacterium sp.]
YTAETITGEEETVLTEENEEENIIVLEQEEEPEETEVPEVEEEPEETETPEVTEPEEIGEPEITEEPEETETPEVTEPEETEEPEITEEPEEPEIPEVTEPEETEEPQEEPEETGEPVPEEEAGEFEEFEEFTELEDAELMSEPISAHNLNEDSSMLQITKITQDNIGQISVTAVWKVSAPTTVFLIAENSTTRYYLYYYEMPGTNVPFIMDHVSPGLPEGQYTLRVATYDASFEKPTLSVSPAFSKKLRILPAPEVSVSKQDDGYYTGAVQVKLPDMTYIDKMVYRTGSVLWGNPSKDYLVNNAVKGVYTISGLPSDDFYIYYEGVSTGDMITLTGGSTKVSIPKTVAPNYIDAYVLKNELRYGQYSYDPLILEYKGQTAQITSELYPVDTVDDTRLTYKSNNTKVVTVDTVGNIKAVGKGETTITVSSKTDTSVKTEVYVKVEPITPKTFKFDSTKAVPDFGVSPVIRRSYTQLEYTLLLTTDSIPSGAQIPVTFTVTGGDGLKIYNGEASLDGTWPAAASNFSNYVTTYTRDLTTSFGEPRAQIHLMAVGGGHYTVTAEALGKKATCTIDVDGFTSIINSDADPDEGAQFYKSGKLATGWITYMDEKFVYGAAGIKPDASGLAGRFIYYVDPSTKKTVNEGIYKIGGKLYYFGYDRRVTLEYNSDYTKTIEGEVYAYDSNTGQLDDVYVLEDGSLLTGWNYYYTDHYYDPQTGFKVRSAWVPAQYSKGVTWVDANGELWDDDGYDLDSNLSYYFEGLHQIEGNWYYLDKLGASKTGWVYITVDDSWNAIPATNKTGYLKIYCDPNNNGQIATESFWAGGKEYRGVNIYRTIAGVTKQIKAGVIIPGPFEEHFNSLKNIKYVCESDESRSFIIGPDGALAKNALVQAYNPSIYGIAWMYADEGGYPERDAWINVKGKSYYFNIEGIYDPSGVSAAETGLFIYNSSDIKTSVYAKPVNAKKPAEGYYYYDKETNKKLTNIMLYDNYDQPRLALNKSGKPAVNTLISVSNKLGGPKSTYVAQSNGRVYMGNYATSGYCYNTVEVKGKLYAVSPDDSTVLTNGLVPIAWNSSHKVHAWGCADKNGVLKRNAFGNVKINGLTYTMYFEDEGNASTDLILIAKGKPYLTATVTGYTGIHSGYYFEVINKPDKEMWTTGPDGLRIYLTKDGSIKLGLLTLPTGGEAYYTLRGGYSFDYLRCWNMAPYPTLWKINNKLYLFNEHGVAVTGWVYFDRVIITDLATEEYLGTYDDALVYFDPKTCAAAAGGWKTVPKPVFQDIHPAIGAEDIGIPDDGGYATYPVNVSSTNAKLYFNNDGILTRSTELTISKKLYMFAADGTSTFKAGWTDANKIYYILKNGQLAKGRQKIDGQYYCFDETGRKYSNQLVKTGKKWYYYDPFGVQATPVLSTSAVGNNLYGSPAGQNLTAVWAKDGSLTKVIYTGSGKPAAGEIINFGTYDSDWDIYSSFILDSKGLPQTGAVYDIKEGYDTNAYLYKADGTRVEVGSEGYYSLVQNGKKYYVLDDYRIQTGSYVRALEIDGSLNALSAKDQKTMESFSELGYNRGKDLYVLVNPDGSVVSDEVVYAQVGGTYRLWHTNRMGVPMDYYTPIYKFGGKWYSDYGVSTVKLYGDTDSVTAQIRTKTNGELVGFYNTETGKALNGMYSNEDFVISLKKGKPQTGKQKGEYRSYYFDAQVGAYLVHP